MTPPLWQEKPWASLGGARPGHGLGVQVFPGRVDPDTKLANPVFGIFRYCPWGQLEQPLRRRIYGFADGVIMKKIYSDKSDVFVGLVLLGFTVIGLMGVALWIYLLWFGIGPR
jgi:hypothetical protein